MRSRARACLSESAPALPSWNLRDEADDLSGGLVVDMTSPSRHLVPPSLIVPRHRPPLMDAFLLCRFQCAQFSCCCCGPFSGPAEANFHQPMCVHDSPTPAPPSATIAFFHTPRHLAICAAQLTRPHFSTTACPLLRSMTASSHLRSMIFCIPINLAQLILRARQPEHRPDDFHCEAAERRRSHDRSTPRQGRRRVIVEHGTPRRPGQHMSKRDDAGSPDLFTKHPSDNEHRLSQRSGWSGGFRPVP